MTVLLRRIQHVSPRDWQAYLDLERGFVALERRPSAIRGRRLRPLVGGEPVDALIWEAEYASLADAVADLAAEGEDGEHERLFAMQAAFIASRRVELYEVLDLGGDGEQP